MDPRYPLNRRLVGPQSQSGRFGEVALAGIPVQGCHKNYKIPILKVRPQLFET